MGVDIKALYNLEGKRIKTLIQVPMYSKIIIASTDKQFKGIKGVDKLRDEIERMNMPERGNSVMLKEPEENIEQVESWLQAACIGWMKKTKNLDALAVPRQPSPVSPGRDGKEHVTETKGKATFAKGSPPRQGKMYNNLQ